MNHQVYIAYTQISSNFDSKKKQAYQAQLPDFIQQKIDRYRRYQDQLMGVFGKHLLIRCLEKLGLPTSLDMYAYEDNKRPFLKSLPQLDFNISHSGNIVLCAASLGVKLGVDIEQIKPIQLSHFKHQFSPTEWLSLQDNINWQNLFFQYWVKKEATTKTDGSGLSTDFSTVEVIQNSIFFNKSFWVLTPLFIHPDYQACLATNASPSIELEKVIF